MNPVSVHDAIEEHLAKAQQSPQGRSSHTLVGGHDRGDLASTIVVEAFAPLMGRDEVAASDLDDCIEGARAHGRDALVSLIRSYVLPVMADCSNHWTGNGRCSGCRHEQMGWTGYQRRWAKARFACAIL